ncbi:MAG: FixH family protein [Nitrospirota bacterium]|nr:FixH family protein [Nitrospirota bacterium]
MNNETTFDKPGQKKERWYFVIIAFFTLIFAANAYFIWVSVDSSRGLFIDKKYEHGIR